VKLPHIQFYPGDWLKDPRLSLCSPSARGVWIDLICAMHELDQSGQLCGTTEELSRLARCSTVELTHALIDLQNKRAADVTQRSGGWVVANRRMKREAERRAKRVAAGSIGGSKAQAKREQTPYDNDIDIDSEGARKRVGEFARGEGIGERDADWFFFKCEGNGWTNGGKPIRDWKATVRTWWRASYFPSQRVRSDRFGKDSVKPLDKSKIEVPERFKTWVAEHYPDKREEAMKWQTWRDVPFNGLREEWWREEKSKLPVDI
jgi:hypothetical protein